MTSWLGGSALKSIQGYLDIGAKVSPRAWELINNIEKQFPGQIKKKLLAQAIVQYFNPDTIRNSHKQEALLLSLNGNKEIFNVIITELKEILFDFEIFKKNRLDVNKIFKKVAAFYKKNKIIKKTIVIKKLH